MTNPADVRVPVVFLWHMHQPNYRLPGQRDALLPWVRLHACKGYLDMADALERHPAFRCVANWSGILIDQLEALLAGARDAWWDLTLRPADALTDAEKRFLLQQFFSIHHGRHVYPDARYSELLHRRGPDADAADLAAFSAGDFLDLQVLFNLHWCGHAMRRGSAVVQRLHVRGRGFCEADKRELLDEQIRWIETLPVRWRSLASRGQVEISATPMHHPILPLLIDSRAALEGLPEHPMPPVFSWPDDALWHVETAREVVSRFFGVEVRGFWPAEGSVSQAAAGVFAGAGLDWIASDEAVLHASDVVYDGLGRDAQRPWRIDTDAGSIHLIFRQRELSDRLGFVYATWDAEDAVTDLVRGIVGALPPVRSAAESMLAIVLDGENPWESYADDGRHFLDALMARFSASLELEAARGVDVVRRVPAGRIARLHAGSWINGNFRIWIGTAEKNERWERLGRARAAADRALRDPGHPNHAAVRQVIAAAEASDWFWWAGDDFVSTNDAQFGELFEWNCAEAERLSG